MTIIRTLAISWLTVRDAVRSRLLVSLAIFLILGLLGLPRLIVADNGLAAQIQVLLKYSLTFVLAMLSGVTLWAACGGVSSELQDRRLYLVLTKPVHRYELWVGKWLGIVALNATLLLMTGLILSLMVWHTLRRSPDPENVTHQVRQQFLVAHTPLVPTSPDLTERARLEADRLMKRGQIPAGVNPAIIQAELIKEWKAARFRIPPGGATTFSYHTPPQMIPDQDLILEYQLESTRPERTAIAAEWTIGGMRLSVTNYPGVPSRLIIPARATNGADTLPLQYRRLDTGSPATLMLAQGEREPELLVPAGNWLINLSRGLIMMLCRLAFLAALGLTAGCLLSMPVAVFVAFFIMVLLASSGYVESVATSGVFYVPHEGPAAEQTVVDAAILKLFRFFNGITRPLQKLDPVGLISEGRTVEGLLVGQAVGVLIGLYSLATAVIGVSLFNRRELG